MSTNILPKISGLTIDGRLAARVSRGLLELPKEFDKGRFAAKWCKVGADSEKAKQRQLVDAEIGAQIDGWSVWKHPRTNQPHKVALAAGLHVLMFRPKALQQVYNALTGNASRKRLIKEQTGETVSGQAPQHGMLTEEVLRQMPGLSAETPKQQLPTLNQITSVTEAAPAVRGTSRTTKSSRK